MTSTHETKRKVTFYNIYYVLSITQFLNEEKKTKHKNKSTVYLQTYWFLSDYDDDADDETMHIIIA